MPQYDGYVRISTENDTSSARRSTEQLGNTIRDAMDTQPVDGMSDGIDSIGTSALNTGDLIRANLLSDTIMQGVKALSAQLKDVAVNAVNGAMSNETAFAKVKTLLKGDNLEKYFEGLIDISNRTGVAFTDLAESMYSALSAGVPQDNVLDFVEKSVNLSKGGFTQTATAIDIVTTALNAYQMEMSEAAHVQDVLITTQNLGKTTVDELASNMGKLIPTAKSVNVAFDQLGAMYATITANGVATAETTTYLNAMINELGASGSSAEKAMMEAVEGTDMAGKKFSEISSMGYDVTDVLVLMSDYAQSTGKSLADMFSSSEGAKAANILLSNMEGFKDNITAMAESTGAADAAAATMMDTTAEKVQVAKNQIDNLVTTIGQALLPVIGEAAEEASEALDSSDIQDLAKDIGGFISGTLSLLLDNLDLIASSVTGITTGIIAFKTASMLTKVIESWTAATVQMNALNTAMSKNPAGLIAVAIATLSFGISEFNNHLDDCNERMNAFNDNAEEALENSEKYSDEADDLQDIADKYQEISKSADGAVEKKQQLEELQQRFIDNYGSEVDGIDLVTGAYADQSDVLQGLIDKKNMLSKREAKYAYSDALEAQKQKSMLKTSDGWANLLAEQVFQENGYTGFKESWGNLYLSGTYEERLSALRALEEAYYDYGFDEDRKAVSALIKELEDAKATLDLAAATYIDFYTTPLEEGGGSKSSSADTSTTPSTSTTFGDFISNDEQLQKFKEAQKLLKYEYDMGEINAEKYYSTLQSYLDKYLSYNIDSDEYRSVSVEIKKFYDNLSEEQKKAYQKQLEEQEKAAAEAESARQKAIEEAEAARKKAYNDEKSQLEFQLKTNKVSEKKYYEEIAKLRDKYLDKNSDEWRSAYLETYEYNQRILQENKDALNRLLSDTADSTLSALQNITAARNSLTSKLIDFNKTFEKITETVPETIAVKGNFTITTAEHEVETYKMGADSIEDNIRVLEQYGAMLDALKSRGADENTLNDILAMDIEEAMEFGTKMLKMSDREWNSYFDSMQRLRQTAADISAQYYRSEAESLKENFVDKLKSELEGLGSDMFTVGADVAAEFVNGWNEALGTKDLTVGDILSSVVPRTIDTAPRAAQQMSAAAVASLESSGQNSTSKLLNIPIYIGTTKLADIMVDALNGKILKDGKNVLLT